MISRTACRFPRCLPALAAFVFCATTAHAYDRAPHPQRFSFGFSAGPTMFVHSGSNSIPIGGGMMFGPALRISQRWSFPVDAFVILTRPPDQVLKQDAQAIGEEAFFGIGADPTFTVAQGSRWGAYISAGGGFSWKQVRLWANSSSCQDTYYCSPTSSESSFQPLVDGGAGITYRVHTRGISNVYFETRYVEMFTPSGVFPGFSHSGTRLILPQVGFRF